MKIGKKVRTIFVIVIIFFVIVGISWFLYQKRCLFTACSFASWETIQSVAFAKTNSNIRIDSITARSPQWNGYAELGTANLEIEITYISKPSDKTSNTDTMYRLDEIKLDDKTLLTHPNFVDMSINHFPSDESQEILARVKIHPRDAFAAGSKLVESDPLLSLQNLYLWANLIVFDNGKAFDGHESVWHVYYGRNLTYSVDARTGEVFSVERWP